LITQYRFTFPRTTLLLREVCKLIEREEQYSVVVLLGAIPVLSLAPWESETLIKAILPVSVLLDPSAQREGPYTLQRILARHGYPSNTSEKEAQTTPKPAQHRVLL
jgi:hypothetical protein